ncbi:arginase family protein [Dyella mobilis]|uniref:Arginase family protein n=1 Tax=Dyella mobilis TaxID=1849582 RepID=A0ABS2KC31_9GAMM|nr:arginase family protein [Dyella mobilis]MBM7128746.1 arginase family protein [Dyella mobilis]
MTAISLLGIPHDANSSFMRGSASAPAYIRRELFSDVYSSWSETGVNLGAPGRLVDRADIIFDEKSDPWDLIEHAVAQIMELDGPLICLGGDHAITHPIMRGVRRHHPKLTILHIDAHPDIYDCYQGNPRSHTSSFARIMEERLADRLIQVGLRTINDHHRAQFERFGVEVIEAGRCHDDLRLDIATPIYLSIDIDGLDPAYAPGVAHREPGGLSPRQVINLIHRLTSPIVGADIVEYNPSCDIANITATVAAKLVKEIGGMMIMNANAQLTPKANVAETATDGVSVLGEEG